METENTVALSNRNGIQTFVQNVEFDRDGRHYDEPCLLMCRGFMGVKNMFVFPLCDAWTVREPDFFKATMQDAAATLFVSPTKNDEHVVGDMILHDIDTIIAWRPDDDATHDHALMRKEVERSGMFLQVNGQTLVDAR